MSAREQCVFCQIVDGKSPAEEVGRGLEAIAIVPLNPVVDGHVLVIPFVHARYVWELPLRDLTNTTSLAATVAENSGACNIIQSNGVAASQTVPHVHFHIVPRRGGDGLSLPWTGQTEKPVGATPGGPCD